MELSVNNCSDSTVAPVVIFGALLRIIPEYDSPDTEWDSLRFMTEAHPSNVTCLAHLLENYRLTFAYCFT